MFDYKLLNISGSSSSCKLKSILSSSKSPSLASRLAKSASRFGNKSSRSESNSDLFPGLFNPDWSIRSKSSSSSLSVSFIESFLSVDCLMGNVSFSFLDDDGDGTVFFFLLIASSAAAATATATVVVDRTFSSSASLSTVLVVVFLDFLGCLGLPSGSLLFIVYFNFLVIIFMISVN